MGQATGTATTDDRRWSIALRPLILLGGFFFVWWFLMTGAAQASGDPDSSLADTARAATGSVERAVVDHEVRRPAPAEKVREQEQAAVAQVTETVRQHVDPVVSSVPAPVTDLAKQTVDTSVKPVTKLATETVRATVGKVADEVRSGLANGHVALPVQHLGELDGPPLMAGESSTRAGETGSDGPGVQHFATASVLPKAGAGTAIESQFGSSDAAPSAAVSTGQDIAAPTLSGGVSSNGAVTPADHDGAASAPSGNAGGLVAGLTPSQPHLAPPTTKTSTLPSADRLPAGPAYRPASSPD